MNAERLIQLNVEMLETIGLTIQEIKRFCKTNDIPIPYEPKLDYLLKHTVKLIDDINAKPHPRIRLISRVQQPDATDDESNTTYTPLAREFFSNTHSFDALSHVLLCTRP